MTEAVLRVQSLTKIFTNSNKLRLKVLDGVSLNLMRNEIVGVIGPSACGKSTLLDCIAGLTDIDQGLIKLEDDSITNVTGKVSYMMQDDVMLPWRNLRQNIILPYTVNDLPVPAEKITALAKLFGLNKFMEYFPGEMSGGMRQRASLLRAYVAGKDVLLLDEPFGKLDAITRYEILHWFLDIWQKKKLSVLLVTHDIDEALFLSDRIYVMSGGPGKIISEIKVPFKRPRSDGSLSTQKFTSLKFKLLKLIAG